MILCDQYFIILCDRAGIGNWTPREQRHTFVSVLSASGVSIEDIAAAVGHVNSTVTKTAYRHQIATRSPQWRPRWTPSLATLAVPRALGSLS